MLSRLNSGAKSIYHKIHHKSKPLPQFDARGALEEEITEIYPPLPQPFPEAVILEAQRSAKVRTRNMIAVIVRNSSAKQPHDVLQSLKTSLEFFDQSGNRTLLRLAIEADIRMIAPQEVPLMVSWAAEELLNRTINTLWANFQNIKEHKWEGVNDIAVLTEQWLDYLYASQDVTGKYVRKE